MSHTLAVSLVAASRSLFSRHHISRIGLALVTAVGLIAATPRAIFAQAPADPAPRWSFAVTEGKMVPTGAQRNAVQRGNLTAAQVAYEFHPALAVGGTLSWARSQDLTVSERHKLDVFMYDLGAEVRAPRWNASRKLSLGLFAGGGAGARSYNRRDVKFDATHHAAAFVSVGSEVGMGRVRLRLDVRSYFSRFERFGGTGPRRSDVVVTTGLRIVG